MDKHPLEQSEHVFIVVYVVNDPESFNYDELKFKLLNGEREVLNFISGQEKNKVKNVFIFTEFGKTMEYKMVVENFTVKLKPSFA